MAPEGLGKGYRLRTNNFRPMKIQQIHCITTKTDRKDIIVLFILSSLWIAMAVLVDPLGNFPLNDDWSFGKSVLSLLESGEYRPTGWTSMTLLAQTLWGSLFCLPFGFSFTALRISSLTMGLIGVLITYFLLRELKTPRWLCALGALSLASNPVYLELSNTFMTDVPFTTCATIGIFLYMSALRTNSNGLIIAGTVAACLAIMIRQPAIFVPIAFSIAFSYKNRISFRSVLAAVTPVVIVFIVLYAYEYWMKNTVGLPYLYGKQIKSIPLLFQSGENIIILATNMAERYFLASIYIGLFLFPVFFVSFPQRMKEMTAKSRRVALSFFFAVLTFSAATLAVKNWTVPKLGNILYDGGLGPITLFDVYISGMPHVPKAPHWVWIAVTSIGLIGHAMIVTSISVLMSRLFNYEIPPNEKKRTLFLLLSFLIYFLFLGLVDYLDRYLLPLCPLGAALSMIGVEWKRFRGQGIIFIIGVLLLSTGLFVSVALTHDYLAFNKARWRATSNLVEERRVPPSLIDGGFEFNGWYLYSPSYLPRKGKSWWWVDEDCYLISLGPVEGYEITGNYSFQRWLPFNEGNVFILKKTAFAWEKNK